MTQNRLNHIVILHTHTIYTDKLNFSDIARDLSIARSVVSHYFVRLKNAHLRNGNVHRYLRRPSLAGGSVRAGAICRCEI